MNELNSIPALLPVEIIERAKALNTTLIADAMDCNGVMDYKIKPVASGMKVVATAMTVNMRAGDNLILHQAIYSGREGYVLVADGKDHKANAYLGELMAGAANAVGLDGIVIDGLVRDKEALCELGLPVFAKGFTPSGPFKDGPGECNTTISCGGVTVHPGDLIIGDEDGVVVVSLDKIEEVFTKAEKKLVYEQKRLEEIAEYRRKRKQGDQEGSIEPSWLKSKKGISNLM
ncbi:4-hydroxy-4-methyl-2-oxoglutarate aldolase/4-carboxy-4-hydroxy-2-oxoadipate aldolase [Peribacillus sp. Bi96]|uniref:RraA family protein n=1 Tax=unclassified Peribacillus TaxID=2675266 RepID=UPI001DC07018|nr:RraA family protein [Peribacillus sp. Bi96]CAH0249738.1 4-hydroxy-4-methyl-2-oxoglutarate aldolase/4-carboxy-4-hydroxy-2-oxoadipate aldolase [Peribacillus sp. Bi96]